MWENVNEVVRGLRMVLLLCFFCSRFTPPAESNTYWALTASPRTEGLNGRPSERALKPETNVGWWPISVALAPPYTRLGTEFALYKQVRPSSFLLTRLVHFSHHLHVAHGGCSLSSSCIIWCARDNPTTPWYFLQGPAISGHKVCSQNHFQLKPTSSFFFLLKSNLLLPSVAASQACWPGLAWNVVKAKVWDNAHDRKVCCFE